MEEQSVVSLYILAAFIGHEHDALFLKHIQEFNDKLEAIPEDEFKIVWMHFVFFEKPVYFLLKRIFQKWLEKSIDARIGHVINVLEILQLTRLAEKLSNAYRIDTKIIKLRTYTKNVASAPTRQSAVAFLEPEKTECAGRKKEYDILFSSFKKFLESKGKPGPLVAVTGRGGMGKSTLVQTFCNDLREGFSLDYASIWLDGTCASTLYESLRLVLSKRRIEGKRSQNDTSVLDIRECVSEVCGYFKGTKVVLVLDNVLENNWAVRKLLIALNLLNAANIFTILTCRDNPVPEVKCIEIRLDSWNPKDPVEKCSDSESIIIVLRNKLGHNPLFLSLARSLTFNSNVGEYIHNGDSDEESQLLHQQSFINLIVDQAIYKIHSDEDLTLGFILFILLPGCKLSLSLCQSIFKILHKGKDELFENSLLKFKTLGLCKISPIIWMKDRNDFKEPDNEYIEVSYTLKEAMSTVLKERVKKLVSLLFIRHRRLKEAVKLQLFRLNDGISDSLEMHLSAERRLDLKNLLFNGNPSEGIIWKLKLQLPIFFITATLSFFLALSDFELVPSTIVQLISGTYSLLWFLSTLIILSEFGWLEWYAVPFLSKPKIQGSVVLINAISAAVACIVGVGMDRNYSHFCTYLGIGFVLYISLSNAYDGKFFIKLMHAFSNKGTGSRFSENI